MNDGDVTLTGAAGEPPFSKGLMAQTLTATGLSPERAYLVVTALERRLRRRGGAPSSPSPTCTTWPAASSGSSRARC